MSGASDEVREFTLERHALGARTEVVEVAGEIDLFAAPELGAALAEAIDSGSRSVVVDLAAAKYVDALGAVRGGRSNEDWWVTRRGQGNLSG